MASLPWPSADLSGDTYRLVPSRFPPISLFENLLDPSELDAAYALESLTNDRLRDLAGDISLVAAEDRVTGPGTTAIMAAFTHIGFESRFTRGQYGVYYAGRDLKTAIVESSFSRARLFIATDEPPQIVTMRCYRCRVHTEFLDLREVEEAHNPDSFGAAQDAGLKAKNAGAFGLLYRSVRHAGGECIAALRPNALVPPAVQTAHYQFHWDGERISQILSISEFS